MSAVKTELSPVGKDLIHALYEVDCDWIGETLGYFAEGHFDAQSFAIATNQEYGPLDNPIRVDQVKHEYRVALPLEPDDPGCDCTYLERCNASKEGSFPVTIVELRHD